MNVGAINAKVKIGALAVMVGAGGWLLYSHNRAISDQTFVNASVVSVREPITGMTPLSAEVAIGQYVSAGQLLATITTDTENPRVSELRGQIAGLLTQRASLNASLQKLAMDLASRRVEAIDLKRRSVIQLVSRLAGVPNR